MPVSALSTDLYELTMMAGYYVAGMDETASFELYVRELPPNRAFLVAAGLEQALRYLESLRFTADEIAFLRTLPNFRGVPAAFFDECLPAFRFTGEVWAVEEGTPVFAHEPLLRITAPLMEAQIVETALLAIITAQTSVASKAARVVAAAGGRTVVEFGSRRAHGVEAALHAARAAYIAGCEGTSNVEAGALYGIPVAGTMAHSWVMAFPDEATAFRRYADLFGERSVFLVDTYDAIEATRTIVRSGLRPSAVRLDSGDIVTLSRAVRQVLDEGGLRETGIFVSGDLDEYRVADVLAAGAPITGFGVGTSISTSNDAPALGGIYKLVEIRRDGQAIPTVKRSPGKKAYPGRKQVWRCSTSGRAVEDVIGLADEPGPPGGVPLLQRVAAGGRVLGDHPPLAALRQRCLARLAELPPDVRRLTGGARYPVRISPALAELTDRVLQQRQSPA